MKATVTVAVMVSALLVGATDAMAWGESGGSGRTHSNGSVSGSYSNSSNNVHASVPEPSALYAVGSALAVLGGAAWYIRRRK